MLRPILGIAVLAASMAAAPAPVPLATPTPSGEGGPNRPPVVRARCNPCTVPAGKTSTVTAEASDPDGKKLTYRWNATAGSIGKASDRETTWTAPSVEGPVPVSVRVADARGA